MGNVTSPDWMDTPSVHVGGQPCWYCYSVSEVLGGLESELEECMMDLVLWVLCWVKLGLRIRWDCGLVIRSRGRWGKCG
ncbi:hypothetical protein ACFX13_042568 [Malus domestica]|uniref:Uncharacterized protein n=1 Tax=Malus domestica TaxID=3750 RepID=A0A498JIR9_MALDO|nr:hypothetical protein DVH24_024640 [Malus domestica]